MNGRMANGEWRIAPGGEAKWRAMNRAGGRRALGAAMAGDDGASPSIRTAGSWRARISDFLKRIGAMNLDGHPSPCPLPARRGEGVRRTGEGDGSWVVLMANGLPRMGSMNRPERMPSPGSSEALATLSRRTGEGPGVRGGSWSAALLLGAAAALLPFVPPATAQSVGGAYALVAQAVGGGSSAGGNYRVVGGLAAPGTGASAGGNYRLIGGLAGVFIVQVAGSPKMKALSAGVNAAVLTWEGDIEGYILEFSPALGEGEIWQPTATQPTGNTFPVVCNQPARFYRLRKP